MEIKFNPSRAGDASATQPAAKSRAAATTTGGDIASLKGTNSLKEALNNISLVRPEKVDASRSAISDTSFPPDEVLKAIATLIAQKM